MTTHSKRLQDYPAIDRPQDLRERVTMRLQLPHHDEVEDGRVTMTAQEIEGATSAAVLVPLVNRGDTVTVMLTQRTAHLTDHAGQISFPGGRVEQSDASVIEAALRETEEEIGLARRHVELLGKLPDYYIPTGFRVTPVVGWVEPPFELQLDEFEVADVFEVPFSHFLNTQNHIKQSAVRNGRLRHFYALPYQGRNIWGATAGMLVTFARILEA